eukprot:403357875
MPKHSKKSANKKVIPAKKEQVIDKTQKKSLFESESDEDDYKSDDNALVNAKNDDDMQESSSEFDDEDYDIEVEGEDDEEESDDDDMEDQSDDSDDEMIIKYKELIEHQQSQLKPLPEHKKQLNGRSTEPINGKQPQENGKVQSTPVQNGKTSQQKPKAKPVTPPSESDSDEEEESLINNQNGVIEVDPKLVKQIIEKDSPELNRILGEFIQNVDNLNNKLKPMMQKVFDKNSGLETKHGMTYLEMKYNLLSSYCQFLSFYLLLKLEGNQDIESHPVVDRLLHIKILLEKLRPLDQKLQYQIDKMLRTAALADASGNIEPGEEVSNQITENPLQYRPNLDNLRDLTNMDQDEESDEDNQKPEDSDDGEDEEDPSKKQIYKASKMNPVFFDDKKTRKTKRDEEAHKRKMANSDYVEQIRKEIYDEPEEVHLGGMLNKKSKFAKEMEQMESLEQEHFKRMSFSKKELKNIKQQEKQHFQERLDQFDDLRDIENILGSRSRKDREEIEMDAQMENKQFQKNLKTYIKSSGPNQFNNKKRDQKAGFKDQKSGFKNQNKTFQKGGFNNKNKNGNNRR